MKRTLRTTCAGFALLVAATAAAPPAAASAEHWGLTERTFYLHLAQYCEAQSLIRWMDEFDWGNDLDGCGGDILDPNKNSWTDMFPTFIPFYANVTTSSTAEIRIYVLSRAVDQTTVEATFDTGYATCTGSDGPKLLQASQVGGFTEFLISCTFTVNGEPDPLVKPKLTVVTTATHTYGLGVEGDHASRITIRGVEPDPPEVESQFFALGERPRATFDEAELQLEEQEALPQPKGNAPAFGLVAPLAALGLAAVAGARIRQRHR